MGDSLLELNALGKAALRYAELGYPVFPCRPGEKRPLTRHGFKDATTNPTEIESWWTQNPSANIGLATAGLLVIDIDGADNPWPDDPALAADMTQCPVARTPRGGRHCLFRQLEGRIWASTAGKLAPSVDTRADGGYIVAPPSVVGEVAYHWERNLDVTGDGLPEPPPWLVELLDGSGEPRLPWGPWRPRPPGGGATGGLGGPEVADPGSSAPLIPAGQRNAMMARYAGAMRRVGMTREEILAGLERANRDRCQPILPAAEVARVAASIARYEPVETGLEGRVACPATEEPSPMPIDPGPIPAELLRVPGFISEVMDHCLATAPYPNEVMAFAGALALQAVLAGRKVRDPADNRTNLYLLGLAHSSAGKDHPRKLNQEILHTVGLADQIGGRFASGEGIQDALHSEPCMLFQTDEIDGMLQSINKARDARHENIMGSLLMLYSAANSIFPMRRKAGQGSGGAIDQPCLVLFGTAIPNHYYEALSERMLTNGFFARMIVLEAGRRPPGQEPKVKALPPRLIETAIWWADFKPGAGNLQIWHPEPKVVQVTREGASILKEVRLEAESEYSETEGDDDAAGTAVWGRVPEHVRKLALLYAISESHEDPVIGEEATTWARRFVLHQVRRMLAMMQSHVAANPFHADCLKVLGKLRAAPGCELPHSVLLKRMKLDAKAFAAVIETLEQRGDIQLRTEQTDGRPRDLYSLASAPADHQR